MASIASVVGRFSVPLQNVQKTLKKAAVLNQALNHTALKEWFLQEKRPLPWRNNPSPYSVWISEVMLQQTRAAVVIPYFLRWMELFPSISALARAAHDEVIKAWEGLGYYSRARNLHRAAQLIVAQHGGVLPSDRAVLQAIPGLGPYTIGAILSFAFHRRAAAVDGNVTRVLTRLFAIEEDIAKSAVQKKLRGLAEELLPDEEPWVVAEALIELGATLCGKGQPKCGGCPLRPECSAHRLGIAARLPYSSSSQAIEALYRLAVIPCHGDLVGVRRAPAGAAMADLYEFPYLSWDNKMAMPAEAQASIWQQWGVHSRHLATLPAERHSYTRYRVMLFPMVFACPKEFPDILWVQRQALYSLAFSAGHRRILARFQQLSLI